MIRAALLVAAVLPFFGLVAKAQDTNVVIQKRPTVLVEDSSEHNRMGKKWVVAGQILGIGVTNGTGQGVIAGHHLDRNTVVQMELVSGTRNDDIFESFELKTTAIGLHAKKFLANSFYINGGLDYINLKYDNKYIFNSSGVDDAYGFEANVWAASFTIGNQWQWESFTLGCDWIGFTMPIANSVSSEYADAGWSNAKKYRDEDKQTLLVNGSPQLLRFYMGATF